MRTRNMRAAFFAWRDQDTSGGSGKRSSISMAQFASTKAEATTTGFAFCVGSTGDAICGSKRTAGANNLRAIAGS